MKKIAKCMVIVVLLFMCGCAQIQQFSAQERANNDITLQIAKDLLPVAETQIGFFRGYGREDEYSLEAINAMDELLTLANTDPNTLSNYDLGRSLGLRCYLTELIFKKEIVSRFWP